MKYVCLGYFDEKAWQAVPPAEQDKLVDEEITARAKAR